MSMLFRSMSTMNAPGHKLPNFIACKSQILRTFNTILATKESNNQCKNIYYRRASATEHMEKCNQHNKISEERICG